MENSFSKIAILFLSLIFVFACREEPATSGTNTALDNLKPETVTVRLRVKPDKLSPWLTTSRYSMHVYGRIHPYMATFDPFTMEFTPLLLKSRPEIATIPEDDANFPGGVSYTCEIKEEAVWDNGQPITANDYVFSLKALFNPKVEARVYRGALSPIKDVRIDPNNPKKFSVIMDKYYMTGEELSGTFIYPEYVYDPKGLLKDFKLIDLTNPTKAAELVESDARLLEFAEDFNGPKYTREIENISGWGPYEIEEWTTGERIVLKRKENWWGDEIENLPTLLKANPKRIIFRPVQDVNATIALLKDGSLDAATEIQPPKVFKELMENEQVKANYNFHAPMARNYYFYSFNVSAPKVSDKRVRRALTHLVDVDFALEEMAYGQATRLINTFMPDEKILNKDLKPIEFSIEKAQTLLSEAGWKDTNGNGIVDKVIDGKLTEMELTIPLSASSELMKNISILWQEQAKKVGVQLTIQTNDFNVRRKEARAKNYDICMWAAGRIPGPYDLSQYWHSKNAGPNGSNITGFSNQRADDLIDQIKSTRDEEARIPLYKEFQEILYEEQPAIFLFTTNNGTVIHKRFDTAAKASSLRPGFFENAFLLANTNKN